MFPFSLMTHLRSFLALILFILSVSATPAPFYNLSTSRKAIYEDINAEFGLVYSVSELCPEIVSFGQANLDKRGVAVLPLTSINEDGTVCTGPAPINFVGEINIRRGDKLLERLELGGMRQALKNNPNAQQLINNGSTPSLIVGWHDGERRCNNKVYPRDTIYFIINEDSGKTISLKKPTQRDVVTIPPPMRALLIVAPAGNICLLADTSSNPDNGVTITVVPDDGSPPTTTSATPAGSPPAPSSSVAPAAPSPPSSTAEPAVPPTVPSAVASTAPPAAPASPVPSAVASFVPESPPSSTDSGEAGAPGTSTPTASPVAPVSAAPVATPTASAVAPVSGVPTASPVNVGGTSPNESPDVVEVVPSPENEVMVDNASSLSADEDGSACFPSSATVIVEGGGMKTMREVEIGDRVLSESGFSEVILFTHRESESQNRFIRVTVSGGETLVVSGGHYVYSNKRQLKAAQSLRRGDVVHKSNGEADVIIEIERVSGVGLFNPQTKSGSIFVNGLLASTYTTSVDPLIAHTVLMVPVRWVYGVSPRLAAMISVVFNHGSPFLACLLPSGAAVIP